MLVVGSRFGAYEILALIGSGGMGEVYRARDTSLNRDVAIKVLPESFATDPDRLARFQREAKTLASLNHPNIGGIYGLEERDGVTALVMELVEGEDLSQRIARGAIPIDEALPTARQIAEALEAAHEKGIIHRDLKPANIKVRSDGTVKVLDFGLAKAMEPAIGSSPNVSQSPTITTPAMMTGVGVILGTAAYMAPEQARGTTVDKRADLWAFGAVLWEMLTGTRPFEGATVSDTLAAVLKAEPEWDALAPATPSAMRRLLRRCLEKDRKRRLDSAAAARLEIEEAIANPRAVPPQTARPALWIAAAAVAAVAALTLAVVHFREASPPIVERMRFEIPFPDNTRPTERSVPALSPDGRQVAFVATGADGQDRLWIRTLDSLEAKPLAGTEGAFGSPFWSPDSRVVVYMDKRLAAERKLRKIDVSGGPSQVIGDAPRELMRGGFWTTNGQIVFGAGGSGIGGLYQVAAAGGVVAPLTTPQGSENAHTYPVLLPDGKHFLYERHGYQAGALESGVFVGSLDVAPAEQPSKRLLPDLANVAFVPSATPGRGFVLFAREGTLFAQSFDDERLALVGEPRPVAERVSLAPPDPFALFSAAANGVLIYQQEGFFQNLEHIWSDRHGQALGRMGESGFYGDVSLSRDGSQAAYQRRDGQHEDLWVLNFERGSRTRFTTNPARNFRATWSPDDGWIVYASSLGGATSLWQKPVGGGGREELILKLGVPLDWSSDGRFLLFMRDEDLWVLSDPRVSSDRTPMPLTRTKFSERVGRFSPDVRWVALQSDESGQNEIYVQSFDVSSTPVSLGGNKTVVSTQGGTEPRWRADGKELFYVGADRRMMAVPVMATSGTGAFRAGIPQPLFAMPESVSWDMAPDGQRFLFTVPDGKRTPPPFTVVLNWQAGLKK